MYKLRTIAYKIIFHILLRLPNFFFILLFAVVFPIYKALHKKRAFGRVEHNLKQARKYDSTTPLQRTTGQDVFRGIFWNALESYRGLSHLKNTTDNIVYENEHIIRDAIAECARQNSPIAAISIHQGAFELLHRCLCRYSKHIHLITDSIGDPAFRNVLKALRSDPHLTEYHPEETGRLIRELFRTKGILAMVVDQGKHTKGNTVSLFGRPSTLYLRLPKKINDMGAGIVTFRTWSENDNNHRSKKHIVIRFESYYPPQYDASHSNKTNVGAKTTQTNSSNESVTLDQSPLVTGIAREVETWIAEHPEQWSWNYHGNFTINP